MDRQTPTLELHKAKWRAAVKLLRVMEESSALLRADDESSCMEALSRRQAVIEELLAAHEAQKRNSSALISGETAEEAEIALKTDEILRQIQELNRREIRELSLLQERLKGEIARLGEEKTAITAYLKNTCVPQNRGFEAKG